MLEHQKPFDSVPEGRRSSLADESAVRVTLSGAGFLLLQSRSESSLQDALVREIGIALPPTQCTSILGDYTLLWLTPAEWLLELPANETDFLRVALTRRLSTSLAAVTDMSGALACCDVSGPRATEALTSGCSLDLRSHAFPSGRAARTALADIPVIISRMRDAQRLRLIVDRSFVGHLRDWLLDVARCQWVSSRQ